MPRADTTTGRGHLSAKKQKALIQRCVRRGMERGAVKIAVHRMCARNESDVHDVVASLDPAALPGATAAALDALTTAFAFPAAADALDTAAATPFERAHGLLPGEGELLRGLLPFQPDDTAAAATASGAAAAPTATAAIAALSVAEADASARASARVYCLTPATIRARFGDAGRTHWARVTRHFAVAGHAVTRVDYVVHRSHVRAFNATADGFRTAVSASPAADADADADVKWVWHGTTTRAAQNGILERNFDTRLYGTAHGQSYGPGVYVSPNAMVAFGYNTGVPGRLLLCKALLPAGHYKRIGDGVCEFYVVPDPAQLLPCYVVHFAPTAERPAPEPARAVVLLSEYVAQP